MQILGGQIATPTAVLLLLALGLALAFEFVNGFHDTANAVATVIYTHSLRPVTAVIWSGLWNLAGVLVSSGAVAFSITALLPVELVLNVGSAAGFAMVFSLLVSAILWNLGTWFFGLPASSSHTLVGSIMGVGLANSLLSSGYVFGEGVNWEKTRETGLSLLISPVVGFCCAALLLWAAKSLIKKEALFRPPEKDAPPPLLIRMLLILTCTGVSFAHGSNDGQKGMGLIMLILVGILPGVYALNMSTPQNALASIVVSAGKVNGMLHSKGALSENDAKDAEAHLSAYLKADDATSDRTLGALVAVNRKIINRLDKKRSFTDLSAVDRQRLRSDFYLAAETIRKLEKQGTLKQWGTANTMTAYADQLNDVSRFIPGWVKLSVALALGLGTMIGWKRIVVTVGEKIGKEHLTYAQGACAEFVAMTTIGAADGFGLPVSTTHVLSSGIAGTMAANNSGLQMPTLRNIALAWLLTLPVCMFLGGALFAFALNITIALGMR